MYFVLRNDDRKMPKNRLILGLISTAAGFVISLVVNG